MDQESVVLEVDPRSVHQAIVQANKDVESWEKGIVGAGDRMQKSLERMADLLIKVNDKSRSSMERLTQSIEKQAAAYGKTGVDRLVAERDRLIKKLGDEEGMINRVRAAYEKMIAVEQKKDGGGAEAFGRQIEQMIRDPLNGAKEAAAGLLEKVGTMGASLAVGVGVLTAIAVAGWEAAKSLGEYGTRIRDVELRTGLAAKEVGQFDFAAKAVGQDVTIVERLMRGLSQAADDTSTQGEKARATMQRLGIDLRTASGEMKPTSLILSEISDALNKLPEGVQRDAAAMDMFKRVGVEAIPFLTELNENLREAKAQGFGPTEDDVRRFTEYQRNVAELQTKWDALMRQFKEGLVTTLTISINWVGAGVKWFLNTITPYGDEQRERQEEADARQIVAAGGIGVHGSRSAHRSLQNQMDQMAAGFMQDKPAIQARIEELRKQQQDLVGNLGWAAYIAPTEDEQQRMAKAASIQKDIEQMQYTLEEADKATRRADLKEGQSYIDRLRSRYFGTHDGIEEAFQQAKKDVERYRKELFEPEHPLTKTEASDLNKKLMEAQGREARAKASLDAESERKKFLTESQAFIRKGDEAELDAIGKIYYQRDLLLQQAAKVKATEAEIAAIRKSADEQTGKVLKDSWEKFEEYDQKLRIDQQNKFLELFLPTKEQLKEWEDVFKAQERIQDIDVQAQKEALRRHANAQVKQAATPEDAYQIRVDLAVKLAQIEVDRIRREDDNAKRMVMAAEAQKQLYTDLAAAQDELEEKRAQAAERAAEEAQREFDTIQKEASGLFHTLLTRPQEFGKQLGNTLREAILKPVTDAFGGMIATAVQPLVGGIGGMFKGIFGTKDPVKVSTDLNTAATAQNSAAVAMLTAVLAGFMGIGMPMFAAPSIPGISGITLPSFSAPAPATRWAGLPKFADGGVTTGPTIVGEAGPEWVIPLKRLHNMGLPPSVNLVGHYGPETTEALGKATGALMDIALPAGLAALAGPAGISVGDTLMALLTGAVAAATPPRNDGVMLGVIPIGPPGAGSYAALSDEAKLARIASTAQKVQVTTRPGEWIDIPGDTIWIGPRQRFAMPGANNEVWGEGLIREVYDPSVPARKQRITTLGIPENQRGQGVGQALYLAALKHGPINWEEPFQSLKITEEASQVRAALVRKGLAERRGDWMVLTEKARRLLGMDEVFSASVRGPRDLEYMRKPAGSRGVRDPQSDWYYKEGGRDDWGMTHDMHVASGRKGGLKSGITRQILMANRDPELDPSGMYIGPPVDVPETTHAASMKLDALLGDRFRNIVWKEVKGVAPGQGQKVRYGDEMLSLIEAGKRIGKDASGLSSWLKKRFPGQPFDTIDLKRALDERGWTGGKLPSYDSGGSVASTGLAVVHKGEAVIPQADTLKHSIDNLTGAMNGNATMFRWLLSSMFGGRTMDYPVAIPGIGAIQIPMGSGGASTTFSISGSGGYAPVSGGSTTALAPEGGYTPAPWAWSKTALPASELQRIDQMVGGQGGKFLSKGVFNQKALKDALSNLKGSVWNEDAWNAYPWTTGGVLAGGAQAIATSPAAGMAGVSLALAGLTGDRRGTWGGAMESAAGGALIGDQAGGPLGAAAGASFGFEVAMFEKLFGVESPQNEAKRLVKQIYSINIDNSMARDIVNIAQQKYAGHVSIAVRDPDVRKMLMLYSQATGQKFPLSASTPQSVALAESGGRLYQQATYVNGMPYTFQSNLPVLGGYQTGTYPMPGGAPLSLQVNVSGQGAAQFVAGQVVTPEFVQAQWSSAGASSNGRLQNSAMIQQPGLLVS
jgi:hypothetical protein